MGFCAALVCDVEEIRFGISVESGADGALVGLVLQLDLVEISRRNVKQRRERVFAGGAFQEKLICCIVDDRTVQHRFNLPNPVDDPDHTLDESPAEIEADQHDHQLERQRRLEIVLIS